MSEQSGSANLEKVDHIVVLMLENRSFDHMLGYLSLEGGRGDIDGLRAQFSNEHDGRAYPIHHLDTTAIADDPDHCADAVDLQLGDGAMDGFVASFAKTLSDHGVQDADVGRVMGYNNGADLPVYDHLASEFAVCDRWFSSVPGATWPNRLYAVCGSAASSRDDLPLNVPPLYNRPSFVRHLDAHDVSWRWYSFETGTLRLADRHYRLGHHDRFAYRGHAADFPPLRGRRACRPDERFHQIESFSPDKCNGDAVILWSGPAGASPDDRNRRDARELAARPTFAEGRGIGEFHDRGLVPVETSSAVSAVLRGRTIAPTKPFRVQPEHGRSALGIAE